MVKQKRCRPKGGNSRLSEGQRKEVVRRCLSGEFYSAVAKDFDISRDWAYKLTKEAKATGGLA